MITVSGDNAIAGVSAGHSVSQGNNNSATVVSYDHPALIVGNVSGEFDAEQAITIDDGSIQIQASSIITNSAAVRFFTK